MYFTTSMAVAAGLCVAFGVLYLFVGLRRPAQRTRHLLFAFFALAYAGAILSARAGFMAATADGFVASTRLSFVFASIGLAFFIWYVAAYTGVHPNVLLWAITGAFMMVGLIAAFAPDLMFGASAGISSTTLPWGETVLKLEPGNPPAFGLYVAALFAVMGYVVVAVVVFFRRGHKTEAKALGLAFGWFAFTLIEEIVVVLGGIDFVVLSDFGFLGFVVVMSLQMVNSAIETETELSDYRTNLETMVEDRTARLEEAQAQLVEQAEQQATTAERTRLARDLHDVVTQLLFSINLIAGSLPRLWGNDPAMAERSTAELQRLTRGALAEMRTLLRELRPNTIAETDLGTLVTQLSAGLAARHDIPADVHTNVNGDLPADVHMAFYRIAQEAMNNVAKHANASSLVVDLTGEDGRVYLSVADDGKGFEVTGGRTDHMGLDIMRERAYGIGAELTVVSEPGAGTTVDVTWSDPANG